MTNNAKTTGAVNAANSTIDAATKPALVIMAAGMGSRFGGPKQITPVTDQGEIILDFSLYDAMLAGFEDVVFIIKKENEADFRALIDDRAGRRLNVSYAFQDLSDIPDGYKVPEGREKPWGTGHAVLAARNIVKGPFAVINADDYYGSTAFQEMYEFLSARATGAACLAGAESESAGAGAVGASRYAMVAFRLANTLSESGHVARGVCKVSDDGKLLDIHERTMIKKLDDEVGAIGYSEDGGDTWTFLSEDTLVSMNFWGFTADFMKELENRFPAFLDTVKGTRENLGDASESSSEEGTGDPLKSEYFLPGVVDDVLKEGKVEVRVLKTSDKWYGVTYKEDKESVVDALRSMKDKGLYPEALW
ncbi:MAG: nucleotidyltransferase [Firmicutes bacterium]|nr:nucleotidyltransferase [Bacillota bacterium]